MIASYAIQASKCYIYIRGEYYHEYLNLEKAIEEAYHEGLIGKNASNSNFNFDQFYEALSQKDFLIYPGKLTIADTFRIGCIGNLNENDMQDTITAIKEVINELQIRMN